LVTNEKRKKEKKQRKKLKQVIESRNKGKEQDHLKEESLSPLRQGNDLTQPRQNKQTTKEQTTKETKEKLTQELPLHMCNFPKPKHTPLDLCMLSS
jgi:hypothetical protein